MHRSSVSKSIAAAAFALAAASSAASPAGAQTNILFYGNSFTNVGPVPSIFKSVAIADGQTALNVENAAVNSQTLGYHLANNTTVITNPQDFTESPGFQWNYVIMQEYSTRPTNVTSSDPKDSDPASFKADAQSLYNTVKAHSPAVTPILFETWARSPNNTAQLPGYYPALSTGLARSTQMQSELRQYYNEAQAQIGSRLAPVGDAFESAGFDDSLYSSDWYHESNKGALLAALVLYDTVYNEQTLDIPYATLDSALAGGLASYGIANATQWQSLATLADQSVPEPATLALLATALPLLLTRRRA
jgi:hypothetical protein